jgi:hypothetical protein
MFSETSKLSQLHLYVSGTVHFFAKLDNSFWMLEDFLDWGEEAICNRIATDIAYFLFKLHY